jgi:hypothetical protein
MCPGREEAKEREEEDAALQTCFFELAAASGLDQSGFFAPGLAGVFRNGTGFSSSFLIDCR